MELKADATPHPAFGHPLPAGRGKTRPPSPRRAGRPEDWALSSQRPKRDGIYQTSVNVRTMTAMNPSDRLRIIGIVMNNSFLDCHFLG